MMITAVYTVVALIIIKASKESRGDIRKEVEVHQSRKQSWNQDRPFYSGSTEVGDKFCMWDSISHER